MRIGRVAHPGGVAFVAVEAEPDGNEITAEIAEHPFGTPNFTGRRWPLADVRVLAPILPTKIVCIGRNYADHAADSGSEPPANPVMFLKPNTTVIGPNLPIRLPVDSSRVDYEVSSPSWSAGHARTCLRPRQGACCSARPSPMT